jgi:hypothetical protein
MIRALDRPTGNQESSLAVLEGPHRKRIREDLTVFYSMGYFRVLLSDVFSKVDGHQAIDKRNIPTLVATPTNGTTFGTLNP